MRKSSLSPFLLIFLLFTSTIDASLLIANYQMDSCSWNGSLGEVKDSSTDGIDNNGTIIGSSVISTKNGKIYNGGQFNGGAIDINDLNISTTSNDKTTVAFWMYWDGANSVMPFGWNRYDLWFYDGKFGFNTSSGDIYGIPDSSTLKNGWHHIVAIFNNGDYTKNKLYIDKVEQTLSQQRGNQANSHAVVATYARIGGWTHDNGYRFKSKIDELKIWRGELSFSTIQNIYDNEVNGKNYDGTTRVSTCIKPIANYQFEDCYYNGTPNEIKDLGGLYDATSINGMISKYDSEKNDMFGRIAKFDGIDDRVKISNFPHLTTSFSITAWFNSSDPSKRGQRIFIDDDLTHGYALSVGDNGQKIVRFYNRANGNDILDTSADLQANTWYFVAAVMDVENRVKHIYLYNADGTLKEHVTKSLDKFPLQASINDVYIGGVKYSGNNGNYSFKGDIDKVIIYKQVLNESQIKNILQNNLNKKQYNGENIPKYKICPVANYRLDDLCNSGGTSFLVAESTNSSLDGIIKPDGDALISKRAKVCSGAQFNGQDQYIDINDSNVFDNTQTLTTTAWIYPTELKQTNGTNARGIFSKRNSYAGNSQYAYGVFFWNGNNLSDDEAALYVDIDTQNDRAHSTKKIKANEWTHITIVFDGRLPQDERTKIYINGVLDSTHKETSSSIPDYSSNFYIGNLYSGTKELKVFKGVMDEVKIYDQALSDSDILNLYTNENKGLDYTGVSRNCICAITDKNVTFNAVDKNGGCFNWDNKIQTKKVNDNIDLTILARDENSSAVADSNITKVELLNYDDTSCLNLLGTTQIWSGNQQTNDGTNGCFELPAFTFERATRCAKIRIYGSYASKEINSTSTDSFAIRPQKFSITQISPKAYASDTFQLKFNALDGSSNSVQDYNESKDSSFQIDSNITKAGCYNGVLNVDNFSFSNGLKNSVDANYSDVGDVNITIREKVGSEFAITDSGDTSEADRLITPASKIITIKPYELNVTNVEFKTSTGNNWLYMSDVNSLNQGIKSTIQANDKFHNIVHNFTALCYAKDVNITNNFYVKNSNSSVKLTYDVISGLMLNSSKDIADINKTMTLPKTLFTTSKADVNYRFNIDRSYKKPYNPITIGLRSVNIIDTNLSKIENNISDDSNTTFYYGRVKTKDINTNKQSVKHTLDIEIYSTANLLNFHQNSLSWYSMKNDNITKMIDFLPKQDFSMNANKGGIDDINSTQNIANGVVDFTITNSWNTPDSAYIHIKIPLYLWYSRYNAYDDNSSSNCGSHPCFKYNYLLKSKSKNIKSGKFSGTSIGGDYNASKISKKGVKVFR